MPASALLSVVIPVYGSQAYLEQTIAELVAVLAPLRPFEIVLVNDGSPDGVQEVIERLHARDPRVRYVEVGRNRGQHAATLRGFRASRGGTVVTLDDDGQNPPEAGLAVAEALESRGLDAVYGRFAFTEQSPLRRLASRLNRWLSRYTIGNTAGLSVSNVRALRGDLARHLGGVEQLHPYIDSMVFFATRRIGEVMVPHRERASGQSTYRVRELVKLWISHMSTFTVLPLKAATLGSFGASVFGLGLGTIQLVRVLHERRAPAGWLSLFCVTTFLFSVLFAFLGILSSYLGRMYVGQNVRGLSWVRSASDAGLASPADRAAANTGAH